MNFFNPQCNCCQPNFCQPNFCHLPPCDPPPMCPPPSPPRAAFDPIVNRGNFNQPRFHQRLTILRQPAPTIYCRPCIPCDQLC